MYLASSGKSFTPNAHEELIASVNLLEDDLPYPELFEQEYFRWKTYCRNKKENIPDSVATTLKVYDKIMFLNIYVLLKLLCLLPVTSPVNVKD